MALWGEGAAATLDTPVPQASPAQVLAWLDGVLEALGAPAFILSLRGEVLRANQAAMARLAAEPALLPLVAAGAAAGPTATGELAPGVGGRVLRLEAPGEQAQRLVVLDGPRETLARKVALANARWQLTRRQQQVLELIAQGCSNKRIADELSCREGTIEAHLTALLRRSGAASRTGLVVALFHLA